jgi:hypothetical protein
MAATLPLAHLCAHKNNDNDEQSGQHNINTTIGQKYYGQTDVLLSLTYESNNEFYAVVGLAMLRTRSNGRNDEKTPADGTSGLASATTTNLP